MAHEALKKRHVDANAPVRTGQGQRLQQTGTPYLIETNFSTSSE